MRVFIGVSLPESIKEQLAAFQKKVVYVSDKGSFTDPENFHLTLQFIGEVDPEQEKTIETLLAHFTQDQLPFQIETAGLGCFTKKNKRIIWVGIKANSRLEQLYRQINAALLGEKMIQAEDGAFIPHLTLGRGIVLSQEWEVLSEESLPSVQQIPVTGLTLFESLRLNGKLVYRPIAAFPFKSLNVPIK